MTTELSPEVMRGILAREIEGLKQQVYSQETLYKIKKNVDPNPEDLKKIQDALVTLYKYIDAYQKELAEIK
jgi:hypothetical protein